MGLAAGRISTSNTLSTNLTPKPVSNQGVVYKVILEETDELLRSKHIQGTFAIGAVQFRLLTDKTTPDALLPIAYPVNKNINTVPTRNEQVFIYENSGDYYYTRLADEATPLVNAIPNLISTKFPSGDSKGTSNSKNYSNVQKTKIPRASGTNSQTSYDGYGNYFTTLPKGSIIHKLRLYEGDSLMESRFGQSIRLSGFNNSKNKFSPSIIIRNGENSESLKKAVSSSTEEDINTDGSIIMLSSGEKILNYTLPTENKYESFYDYPSELMGNQILLNSDRIILSAKSQEMIFASKLNMGFITDNQFSIDASRGIDITVDDEIDINTNDFDFNINIGNAIINLGTDGEMEKAPKGDTLVKLLGELIDLISKQQYATPAGLTSVGPLNVALFTTLKNKLESMLSNNVKLK